MKMNWRCGHPQTEDNFSYSYSDGRIRCKICKKARGKRYELKYPQKIQQNKTTFMRNNKDKAAAWTTAWMQTEEGKRCKRASTQRYNARKIEEYGTWLIPEAYFYGLLYETYPFCYYCQDPLNGQYEIEHKIPLSRPEECPVGRKLHEPWNIRLACKSCNSRKNNKTKSEFERYLGQITGGHR